MVIRLAGALLLELFRTARTCSEEHVRSTQSSERNKPFNDLEKVREVTYPTEISASFGVHSLCFNKI